jgi:hypothetical protein
MLPLLALSKINWWRVGVFGTVAIIIVMFLHTWGQGIDLAKARAAYEHPRVVTVYKKVRVQGPVRIVTRTIEVPGRKEVVSDELRGGFSEVLGADTLSEPVLSAARTDRWLVGVGPSWRYNEAVEWNGVFGRSFSNRVDIQGEISQKARVGARVVFRFWKGGTT